MHSFRLDLPEDDVTPSGGSPVGPAGTASAALPASASPSRHLLMPQWTTAGVRHCHQHKYHAHPYPHILRCSPAHGQAEAAAETPSSTSSGGSSVGPLAVVAPQQQAEDQGVMIAGGGEGGGGGGEVHVGLHALMSLVQVREGWRQQGRRQQGQGWRRGKGKGSDSCRIDVPHSYRWRVSTAGSRCE